MLTAMSPRQLPLRHLAPLLLHPIVLSALHLRTLPTPGIPLHTLALLVSAPVLLNVRSRRKVAFRTYTFAEDVKDNGHRHQHRGHTPKQGTRPLNAHTIEHESRKQRENAPEAGAHESVCGDSRGGKHEVCVNDVVEQGEKDGEDAEAGEKAAEHGDDPVYVSSVACPSEPEQTGGKQHTADHTNRQAPFGNGDVVVGFEFADVAGVVEDDDDEGDDFADDHAEVREAAYTGAPAVNALEDEGVGGEEEVKQAICSS
jgi:hypothetical protein